MNRKVYVFWTLINSYDITAVKPSSIIMKGLLRTSDRCGKVTVVGKALHVSEVWENKNEDLHFAFRPTKDEWKVTLIHACKYLLCRLFSLEPCVSDRTELIPRSKCSVCHSCLYCACNKLFHSFISSVGFRKTHYWFKVMFVYHILLSPYSCHPYDCCTCLCWKHHMWQAHYV